MADFGLTPADFLADDVDVWPDCWRAVTFFGALGAGSWSLHPRGHPVGIRPEAFTEIKAAFGVTADEWPDLLSDVRVMERAALEQMRSDAR